MTDESIDFLDIYADFLGVSEYTTMKEHYQKALATMHDINMLELERFRMKAPVTQEELGDRYGQEVLQRFGNVHEAYLKQGKTRDKYMQRLKLEFKDEKSIET